MNITYPHVIENCIGEKLIFHGIEKEPDGEKVIVENYVTPGNGPVMHTHWLQDEALTVIEGRLGYQVLGQPEQFATIGETVLFKRGIAHKFWNAGNETLRLSGYVSPANNMVYFLSQVYRSMNENGGRPGMYDAAYLLGRYKTEFRMLEIPTFVQKLIFPVILFLGSIRGKKKKFVDAPAPL